MSKFVPRPKLSKKARKELDAQKRTTWAFSPVTKKVESKKIYNRKKTAHAWRDDSSMSGFLLHWGWYRGERRPWQHLNHVTGLQDFLFEREQRQAVLEIILEMRLRGIDFAAVIPETRE